MITLRPHIVIQAGRYQVKNWRVAAYGSFVDLTQAERRAFSDAHMWCIARNAKAGIAAAMADQWGALLST